MLQIFSNSRDLANATNYAQIARPKASKATKVFMQHKKARFDDVLCMNIDKPKAKAKASKQARQNAAKRAQKKQNKKQTI